MRYYYLAPENQLRTIYSRGVSASADGYIRIIVLEDSFLMDKYLFDVIAWEIMNLDVYCLFQISEQGIEGRLEPEVSSHLFAPVLFKLIQGCIDSKFVSPYPSNTSYEGMGLETGVFPIENKDKFTDEFKQKILDYLKAL